VPRVVNALIAANADAGRAPAGTMRRVIQRSSYTISDDATEHEVASVCEAALVVLWDDLEWFAIDLAGLDEDPDCADGVAALQGRRGRHLLSRKLDSSAHLVPGRDDELLSAILPLLSRTVGSTGLSREDAHMIYDANDGGSSCLFELTSEQHDVLQQRLMTDGVRPEVLLPWRED